MKNGLEFEIVSGGEFDAIFARLDREKDDAERAGKAEPAARRGAPAGMRRDIGQRREQAAGQQNGGVDQAGERGSSWSWSAAKPAGSRARAPA